MAATSQLPQIGPLQHIPCSGSDAEITRSHLQGCQLLSQASICLGGIQKHQQDRQVSQESPQQQARGTRQLTTNFKGKGPEQVILCVAIEAALNSCK